MQLLSPTSLFLGALSYFMWASFPSHHVSAVLADHVVMKAIYARRWMDLYHDSKEIGHIPLHALLQTLWTKSWIVFVFLQGNHFTANAVQYSRIQTADGLLIHGRIHHLDSFLNTNQLQLNSTMLFLEWTYAPCSTPIITGQWELVDRPMGNMIKQHMYLPPGRPDHIQLHIDCALYVNFMTLQIVSGGQVCGFTPKGIHYARPILALHLVKYWPLPDIRYWLPNDNDVGLSNCMMSIACTIPC